MARRSSCKGVGGVGGGGGGGGGMKEIMDG